MSDAAKEAFKLGFLTRCAEERLTGDQLTARLEKVAVNPLTALATLRAAMSTTSKFAPSAMNALYWLPVAGGLTAGAAGGWGAAKMLEPKIDEDQVKAQELAHTYRVYADRLQAHRKSKQYRSAM